MAKKKRDKGNLDKGEKGNFNLSKFVYGNFMEGLEYLKESMNFFWFSFILFFGVSLFGFFYPHLFEEQIIKLISEIIGQTEGLGVFGLISFIINNNIKSSFIGIVFGIFLGLVPLGIIVINGYVLGFVANKSVASGGLLVLWRLLPHGIFEIPAVLISVALGLKLGMFLFIYRGENKWKEFWRWLAGSFKVFLLIVVPLLVFAGLIEGVLIWGLNG